MRIGIHNTPSAGALGGSEYLLVTLAHALSSRHQVDFIHHFPELTRAQVAEFSGLPVDRLRLRHADKVLFTPSGARLPWNIWRDSRRWNAEISEGYDLFVTATHWIPPFCHAQRGLLIVLFPFFKRDAEWPFNDPPCGPLDVRRFLRNTYYSWEWRRRLATYEHIVSISEFTRTWTRTLWGTDSKVIYPPVNVQYRSRDKRNEILSVGRFTTRGHGKKHAEMIAALGGVAQVAAGGWSYHCVGALSGRPEDQACFKAVSELAHQNGAVLHANLPRAELVERFELAKIFVHGTGLNEPTAMPEHSEHFGIATVEAMAAGCVPVVINRGGQPEIVTHGESGFLWNDVAELRAYVSMLAEDRGLLQRMSHAARERAQRFSTDRFVADIAALLESSGSTGLFGDGAHA